MKFKLFLILTALYTHLAFSTEARSLDDFYKKAFASKSKSSEIFLPLIVNNTQHTEVFAIIKGSTAFIKKEDIKYITDLIKEEYRNKFKTTVDKSGFTAIDELNQQGVLAIFDEDKVYLKITIPPELKKAQMINLKRTQRLDIDGSVLPESYSGGANFFLNHNIITNNEGSQESAPLSGASEIFFNAHSFHIEGRISYEQDREDSFIRERVRLVKDDEEHQIRYQMGDIFLPQHQRLGIEDSLGIGFEKIFDMDDDYQQNVSRINSFEFFLKNSSRVEIYVNRRYTRGIHLPAGTHNLYDLNIPNGLSNIQLKIIEDSGKIEYIDFNDFDYNELFKEGVSRYGGGVGIVAKRDAITEKRIYNQDDKFLSLYAEYGLFSFLTLKSGTQLKQDFQSFAFEPIVGTPIGLFDIYALTSQEKLRNTSGTKFGLNYRTNVGSLNFSFLAEQSSEDFKTLTSYQDTEEHSTVTLYQGSLYTPLFAGVNLNLTGSQYTESGNDQKKYSVELSKAFTQNLELQLNYSKDFVPLSNIQNKEIYVALNYRYGNSALRYDRYIEEKRDLVSLTHRTDGYYNIASNIDIENSQLNQRLAIREDVRNEKFRFSTNYTQTKPKNGTRSSQNLSSQFSTALLFAGSSWTISEPISSSFIIVDNDEKLEESPLGIKGYQEGDDYTFDSFAIQSTDYRSRSLIVNEENLDMGINLLHSKQTFISKYRSGSKMNITVKSLFSLKGRLIDQNKKPITLRAFKVFNIVTGNKEMVFTNDNGEFILEDVENGQYNAVLFRKKNEDGIARFSFTVDKSKHQNTENLIHIGDINVQLPKQKIIKKKLIKNVPKKAK